MDKLRQDLKAKHFENIYLLYGDERYLVQQFKNQLKNAIIGDDTMNFNCYTGKEPDIRAVTETVMTMPFFAASRLVILEDTGLFKSSDDAWVNLVGEIPHETIILFIETDVDKRSRMYKAVRDKGYCCELKRQDQHQLAAWVIRGLSKSGLKITEEALNLFLERAGDDMENIRSEMEKLCSYCAGKEGVVRADIEAICTQKAENRIFEMIQAVSEGRTAAALELYYDLLALKEPGMRILFLIARQMNQLLCVKEMAVSRQNKDAIAAALKIKPFIANKLMGQARAFTAEQLKSWVEKCAELEEAVKKGNVNERIAVEMVLLSISKRI